MSLDLDLLKLFIILLPGFLTAKVVRSMAAGEPDTETDKVTTALVYSLVTYGTYAITCFGLRANIMITTQLPIRPLDVLALVGISAGLGLGISAYRRWDGHRVFHFLRITSRTARPTVWNDFVYDKMNRYLCVEFADGTRLQGWLEYYPDRPEDQYLYFTCARWVSEDGSTGEPMDVLVFPCASSAIRFVQAKPEEKNNVSRKAGQQQCAQAGEGSELAANNSSATPSASAAKTETG